LKGVTETAIPFLYIATSQASEHDRGSVYHPRADKRFQLLRVKLIPKVLCGGAARDRLFVVECWMQASIVLNGRATIRTFMLKGYLQARL